MQMKKSHIRFIRTQNTQSKTLVLISKFGKRLLCVTTGLSLKLMNLNSLIVNGNVFFFWIYCKQFRNYQPNENQKKKIKINGYLRAIKFGWRYFPVETSSWALLSFTFLDSKSIICSSNETNFEKRHILWLLISHTNR